MGNDKTTKQPFYIRRFEDLLDDRYPIGWGTGMNGAQWRKFADEYVPMSERKTS